MGTVVFPGLGPGLGSTINPFDPDFQQKLLRQKNQEAIDKQNADAAALYKARAKQLKEANVQQQATGQRLFTLDPPPHKKVLDAAGNVVDSVELVCDPMSVLPDPPTGPASAPGGGLAQVPLPDRLDQVIAMLMVLKQDIDAVKQKVGA